MSSFIKNLLLRPLRKISLSNDSPTTIPTPSPPFDENPCTACPNPCEHPRIPDYLLKKIDRDLPLEGTVHPHQRHVLVCTGKSDWPDHAEKEEDSLVKHLFDASQEIQDGDFQWSNPNANTDSRLRIVVTAISRPTTEESTTVLPFLPTTSPSPSPSSSTRHDVILLPEGLLVPSVPAEPSAARALFDTWLGKDQEYNSEATQNALGARKVPYNWIVLTCGHKRRDKRCGVAGPMIADTFDAELKKKGFSTNENDSTAGDLEEEPNDGKKNVGVWLCSHTGGHKFAGNVIVYPGGIWYGRVQPCHVPCIVERHLIGGRVVREFYRGTFDGPENGSTVAW